MSFGFAVGDFIAVGDLAWRLYRDCYKIARGAPQEFQLLVGEISTLSNSLAILQEEVKDPTSTLVQAGEDRVRMVTEMISGIGDTLKRLEKVAKNYEILGSGSKRRQIWAKFKWSVEFSRIDALRNKLIYHNTVMNLLLTSVGNSSLQRIESSTAALENDVKAIRGFIVGHQGNGAPDDHASRETDLKTAKPTVSAVDDELFKTSLTAAFMTSAEVTQPWSTIGVDQWIESGRWWLLRAQMELYTISEPKQKIPLGAYANLIKASWILVDIIACHPQVPFIASGTHSDVQLLSAELKNEFSRLTALDSIVPDLSELEGQDLRIWETQARGPLLRPHKHSRQPDEWIVDGGEQVLFQRFAMCELHALSESLPCILLFLVHGNGKSTRLVAQNQNGSIIMVIPFQKYVEAKEFGSSVIVNDEKIVFTSVQDAQFLGCLIEATNFYYFGRKVNHTGLEELKGYMLLTAVKNKKEDAVGRLLQRAPLKENALDSESDGGPVIVASVLASQRIAHQLKDQILPDSDPQRSTISLFSWAVQCGLASLVRILLIEEPTTDGNDWHGMTPLGLASFCGHEPVVRLLLGSEANVRARDSFGCVALHHACFKGHEKVARLLLRSGAEVGANATKDQVSALHFAVRNNHEKVAQLLIDRGANIEARNQAGFTALCEATSLHHEAVITLLLEEGANVNQRNNEGINATHYALESKMSDSTVRAILARQLSTLNATQDSLDNNGIRKAQVVLELDSDWGRFYLDSPQAIIGTPEGAPSNVDCVYGKSICITRPPGTSAKFFKFKFEFTIMHTENTLHFSIGHGTLGTTKTGGSFKIKIVNGGERIGRPTRIRGRNFQIFTNVELDKTSTTHDSEDRKIYRQVKDQLYKNLSWEKA